MKAASAAMIALLASNQFLYADIFDITLQSGAVLRYTSGDGDLVFGGNTYSGKTVKIARDRVKTVVGIQVASIGIRLWPSPTDLIGGISFPQFACNGGFDGAYVLVQRVFMPVYGDTSAGALHVFGGRADGEVAPGRTEIKLTVNSDIELLNVPMPRNVYTAGCLHTLFDSGCTLLKANFAAASTAASGSTQLALNCALAQAANYFTLGTVSFTSGANAGATRTVKAYTPGVFTLSRALPYTPAVGDAFTAYPGCDKSQATCTNKFNNVANIKAFPYIPVPATAL